MDRSLHAINDAATVLATLEPGKLPLGIFNEVARLTVTPVVEIVSFYRDESGALKVYLLQRNENDRLWPGMYHVPGGIVLATDTPGSFSDALRRILNSKMVGYQPSEPTLVDMQLCKVSRGTEVAIVYMVALSSAPAATSLFDPENLPNNMIEGQAEFIRVAVNKFETN